MQADPLPEFRSTAIAQIGALFEAAGLSLPPELREMIVAEARELKACAARLKATAPRHLLSRIEGR